MTAPGTQGSSPTVATTGRVEDGLTAPRFLDFCRRSLRAHQLVPGLRYAALPLVGVALCLELAVVSVLPISCRIAALGVAGLCFLLGRGLANEAFGRGIRSFTDRRDDRLERRNESVRRYLAARGAWRVEAVDCLIKGLEAALRRAVAERIDFRLATAMSQATFTGMMFWLAKVEFDAGRIDAARSIILLAVTVVVSVLGLSFMAPTFTSLLRRTELDIEEGLEALLDVRLQITLETEPGYGEIER